MSDLKNSLRAARYSLPVTGQSESLQDWSARYSLLSWIEYGIILLAAALRLWALDVKPPHFDEGINGWFADCVRQQGFYAYDPTNYHGPLYFYVLFIVQTLFGRGLWALRMPAVLGSVASVWLAFRFDRFLGKTAARWGALALAVSPAAVFYGRYAIHESWVATALMVVLLGLFGLWHFGERRSLFTTVLGVTLLLLLKETAVIHFASLLLLTACLLLWHRLLLSRSALVQRFHHLSHIHQKIVGISGLRFAEQSWSYRDLCWSLVLSLAVLFFFYSGGLLNSRGFFDLFRTLPAWIHTGTGAGGHVKAEYQWGFLNYYWLALMARYEWPSLLGFFYSLWLLWRGSRAFHMFHKHHRKMKLKMKAQKLSRSDVFEVFDDSSAGATKPIIVSGNGEGRFLRQSIFGLAHYLAIYGGGVFVLYSVIPYKTPWCLISILWPFSLLFGVLLQEIKWRRSATILGVFLLAGSLVICLRLNFWNYTNPKEPYVYVQTSSEIERLTTPLLEIAQRDPCNFHLRGQILLESYYPIPWMLGDFTAIGYFSEETLPRLFDGDFIVVEVSRSAQVEKQLHEPYYREEFQLRDAMETCVVYFKKRIFQSFFEDLNIQRSTIISLPRVVGV